jgi:hypothetical protein
MEEAWMETSHRSDSCDVKEPSLAPVLLLLLLLLLLLHHHLRLLHFSIIITISIISPLHLPPIQTLINNNFFFFFFHSRGEV